MWCSPQYQCFVHNMHSIHTNWFSKKTFITKGIVSNEQEIMVYPDISMSGLFINQICLIQRLLWCCSKVAIPESPNHDWTKRNKSTFLLYIFLESWILQFVQHLENKTILQILDVALLLTFSRMRWKICIFSYPPGPNP